MKKQFIIFSAALLFALIFSTTAGLAQNFTGKFYCLSSNAGWAGAMGVSLTDNGNGTVSGHDFAYGQGGSFVGNTYTFDVHGKRLVAQHLGGPCDESLGGCATIVFIDNDTFEFNLGEGSHGTFKRAKPKKGEME